MNFFTYNDYKDYEKNNRIKKKMEREMKNIEYIRRKEKDVFLKEQNDDEIDRIIDIQIKELLKDKEEVRLFIKDFLKTDNQELKDINDFSFKDQLYQVKNKEIYFLIKYQTKIDTHLSYKILLDSNQFMKEWESKKSKEQMNFPILIPIVLYSGKEPWIQCKNRKELKYITYEKNGIYLKYNQIDINQYPSLKLIKMKSCIANLIVLKRYSDKKERKEILEFLLDKCDTMEKFLKLSKIKRILE